MKHERKEIAMKMPALNERFHVITTVSPQIMQCKLASYYPAGSSVKTATTLIVTFLGHISGYLQ